MSEAVSQLEKLTRGRLLARNTFLNLLGQGAPMLAAFFAIPFLVKGLGTERFGVLTLVWLVLGYFGLFDLGLGRALTQMVALKLGTDQSGDIPPLVWTTLPLMMVLGVVGGVIVGFLAPWLVQSALKVPVTLQPETLHAFYLLALSLPLVVSAPSLRGLLEAHQRFDLANAVSGSMGVYAFLAPLAALSVSRSLTLVVAVLLLGRLVVWVTYLILGFYVIPSLRHGRKMQLALVKPLARFGGWMTVSNIISPLMVYLDRFLIGAFISMAAVAYYATPFEVVTKLWLIPGAVAGVLFPALSTSFSGDKSRAANIYPRGVKFILLGLFPCILALVTLAPEGLEFWLGKEFSRNSALVLQLLAIGVFINSLAHVPSALLQAADRPDLCAKLHLMELPCYLLVCWWLIKSFGIRGAAVAWVLRVTVDAGLVFYLTQRLLPSAGSQFSGVKVALGGCLLILALAGILTGLATKVIFLGITLAAYVLAARFVILSHDEWVQVQGLLRINNVRY